MRFFRFYRKNSCHEDVPGPDDPVQPKVQESVDTVVQPCDGKKGTSSAGIKDSEGSKLEVKYRDLNLMFVLVMLGV